METEKEKITEDVFANISSYLKIVDAYINEHLNIEEIVHIGLIIDKMNEEIEKLKTYYTII
ncbi:hypothetical protein IJ596_02380 [bacterium]|nr:hypothetical protein [bacterium]